MNTRDQVREMIRAEFAKHHPLDTARLPLELIAESAVRFTEGEAGTTFAIVDETGAPRTKTRDGEAVALTIPDLVDEIRIKHPKLFGPLPAGNGRAASAGAIPGGEAPPAGPTPPLPGREGSGRDWLLLRPGASPPAPAPATPPPSAAQRPDPQPSSALVEPAPFRADAPAEGREAAPATADAPPAGIEAAPPSSPLPPLDVTSIAAALNALPEPQPVLRPEAATRPAEASSTSPAAAEQPVGPVEPEPLPSSPALEAAPAQTPLTTPAAPAGLPGEQQGNGLVILLHDRDQPSPASLPGSAAPAAPTRPVPPAPAAAEPSPPLPLTLAPPAPRPAKVTDRVRPVRGVTPLLGAGLGAAALVAGLVGYLAFKPAGRPVTEPPANVASSAPPPAAPSSPPAVRSVTPSPSAPPNASPPSGSAAPTPPPAGPVRGLPEVLDTSTLRIDGRVVRLFGVEWARGGEGVELTRYLRGREVACQPAGAEVYRCQVAGQDLSRVVLFNGGGRATAEATPELLAAEEHARQARLGVWRR